MNWHLLQGKNEEILPGLPSNSFDTIITDPPYGLNFMGKHWDYDVPSVEVWKECLRVLKPGGTALIFAGSRTQHRMAVNVEDAGFELKDCIMWLYGSGFPKATDISKQLDKKAGVEFEQLPASGVGFMNPEGAGGYNVTKHQLKKVGESCPEAILWNGWKSHGLKPAYEPIIVAMKPNEGSYAANAMKWGVSGLNIDGGRIEGQPHHNYGRTCSGGLYTKKCDTPINTPLEGRFPANIILDEDFVPTLCLTNNIDFGILKAIKEYFYDYELPNVPKRVCCISESDQKRSAEILQQKMLLQSTIKTDDRSWTSPIRKETQSRSNKEDETETYKNRSEQSDLQGVLDVEGIQVHQHTGTISKTKSDGSQNVAEGKTSDTRTSFNNGNENRTSSSKVGSGASSEWSKGRQSARKFRSIDQHNSQDESQTDIEGIKSLEEGERRIEILACDIPIQWLKYFEPTGYEIRDPNCAAAMLDEQTGVLKSGSGSIRSTPTTKEQKFAGINPQGIEISYSDSGGASRFFYCAKASKAERNAGLDKNYHPTVKPLALMEYLCTLTKTPLGGIVLDPWAGSGTTGIACLNTGRECLMIERETEYCQIIERRMTHAEKINRTGI